MRKIIPVVVVVIIVILVAVNMLNPGNEQPQDQTGQPEKNLSLPEEPVSTPEEPLEIMYVSPSRYSKIPDDVVKITPETDINPPHIESDEYYDPVPVPGLVNTRGGEDSSFVLPSGDTLYFFFTPDVRVPTELQVIDGVTGIYVSELVDGEWSNATRVLLQDPDKLAMDGCEIVVDDEMYFVSAREGYTGLHWFKADLVEGEWVNWSCVDDWLKATEYDVGELHFTHDMKTVYFHSAREGGKGQYDIWVSHWGEDGWGEPENLEVVNSESYDGWPSLSPDETELWFSRDYGLWRSKLVDGEWSEPERMFFPLCGESTIDNDGNVYFTHHFYDGDVMLEADIYVAYKKTS